jgi:hypothetical protein
VENLYFVSIPTSWRSMSHNNLNTITFI